MAVLLVAVGGALGSVSRWAMQELLAGRSAVFPTATFLINVSGCFLIGAFASAAAAHADWSPAWRLLFPIGFVGAYTTFSTYELEIFRLLERGEWAMGALYFFASNLAGFAGIAAGIWAGKRLA
jgi:CrcB protein